MPKKNDFVNIHNIVLNPDERAKNIPSDTSLVPLEMWVKGFLLEDASIGDKVEIKTLTGRIEKGTLIEVNPSHKHNYGDFVKEIFEIGYRLKKELYGGDDFE